MEIIDIESCLKSMSIIVDSREQPSARAEKRYAAFSVPYSRQMLDFGDYTYNCVMPDGSYLFEPFTKIKPDVVIERKMNLEELSQCFCQSRDRFEREFQRATEAGATVYLLVENASWENVMNGKYKTRFNAKAYTASLTAWMARYNTKVIFCKSETSGKLIQEILYRELKNKLEGGFYDGRQGMDKD